MMGSVDIINSTLGKALGGAAGGYTTGNKELIDLLRQKSRPYLFSNSLPPPVVASGMQVLNMLFASDTLTAKVKNNTKRFRDGMTKAGFTIAGMDHPIAPVMLGDARLATTFADAMLGWYFKTLSELLFAIIRFHYSTWYLCNWIQFPCGAKR